MAPLIKSLTSVLALATGFAAAAPSERKERISIRSVGAESVTNSYIVKYKVDAGHDAIKASQAKALELIKQAAPVSAPGRLNNEPTFCTWNTELVPSPLAPSTPKSTLFQ
jgi:hypothetical protein